MVEHKEFKIDDVELLIENIRQDELNDLEALSDLDLREAIISTIKLSQNGLIFSTWCDEGLISIAGVVECDNGSGRPWLLGTKLLDVHKKSLIKLSEIGVATFFDRWLYLYNWIDCRNKKTIGWLKYLGFIFDEPVKSNTGFYVQKFWLNADGHFKKKNSAS